MRLWIKRWYSVKYATEDFGVPPYSMDKNCGCDKSRSKFLV